MTTDLADRTGRGSAPAAISHSARGSSAASSRRAIAHLGNDLGAIRNYVALQDEYEAIYCIVDYHALTSTHDPDALRRQTREMAARCWRSAWIRTAARCSSRATARSTRSSPGSSAPSRRSAGSSGRRRTRRRRPAPARRHQPRPADLSGAAGRRHRHLQGLARAGRQGSGGPPRADRARSSARSTTDTARRFPSRRPSSPRRRRPGHRRRPEDEQVARQHDRHLRASRT